MSIIMITTHGFADNQYGIDPALFAVERLMEHITVDDALTVTVQYQDSDGVYTQVFADMPWSNVRRGIMDIASFVDQPMSIIVALGSIVNVQYGPLEEGWDWVEPDDEDGDEETEQ